MRPCGPAEGAGKKDRGGRIGYVLDKTEKQRDPGDRRAASAVCGRMGAWGGAVCPVSDRVSGADARCRESPDGCRNRKKGNPGGRKPGDAAASGEGKRRHPGGDRACRDGSLLCRASDRRGADLSSGRSRAGFPWDDGRLCAHLSRSSGRAGDDRVFQLLLRPCPVFLPLADQRASGRDLYGMADLYQLLDLRYLRVSVRNGFRKA